MKDSIERKLQGLVDRFDEISGLLSDAEIINNQNKFRDLSLEYSKLEDVVNCYKEYQSFVDAKKSSEEMLNDPDLDAEMKELAKEEIQEANEKLEEAENQLQVLLLPKDPDDGKNVFLEIRAGTGGDEAAIFAGDLFRMYIKYAENLGWRTEVMSVSEGEHGGYKEIIVKISGQDVYSRLKYESGAHRVQRVPATESQGRVHTSACTVAVMPEVDEIDGIDIDQSDLKIDTYRSSGAGGQHVNTTDSAIRITHIPTGVVVECQDERSQHKNKAKALSLLQSRILEAQRRERNKNIAAERKSLVGSGDRSERIRTYNYPQGRVTDHRINLTLYKLDDFMEGNLNSVIVPLQQEDQAEKLANLDSE